VYLLKGKVVGVAESQESASICTVPVEPDKKQRDPSWEDTVRTQCNHLNVDEKYRLGSSKPPGALFSLGQTSR
jgi:hypothetical protein